MRKNVESFMAISHLSLRPSLQQLPLCDPQHGLREPHFLDRCGEVFDAGEDFARVGGGWHKAQERYVFECAGG